MPRGLLLQPGSFRAFVLVRPESLPHDESIQNVRHSAKWSRYRRTATSAFEMKLPECQDFGGGKLAHVHNFDPRHSERVANRRGQLEHFLAPPIDALERSSEPDVVLLFHVGCKCAGDLVPSALAPELPVPPRKFHVLLRHRLLPPAPRLRGFLLAVEPAHTGHPSVAERPDLTVRPVHLHARRAPEPTACRVRPRYHHGRSALMSNRACSQASKMLAIASLKLSRPHRLPGSTASPGLSHSTFCVKTSGPSHRQRTAAAESSATSSTSSATSPYSRSLVA